MGRREATEENGNGRRVECGGRTGDDNVPWRDGSTTGQSVGSGRRRNRINFCKAESSRKSNVEASRVESMRGDVVSVKSDANRYPDVQASRCEARSDVEACEGRDNERKGRGENGGRKGGKGRQRSSSCWISLSGRNRKAPVRPRPTKAQRGKKKKKRRKPGHVVKLSPCLLANPLLALAPLVPCPGGPNARPFLSRVHSPSGEYCLFLATAAFFCSGAPSHQILP